MGNEVSVQAARTDELALVRAVISGDLEAMQALLKQNPQLVYSHSKAGENIWHFAAQGGHVEVLKAVAAAVESVLAGQKKQDKFKAHVNHGFNQVNQAVNQVISHAVPLPAAIAIPMQKDIGINAATRDGLTPLMAAVKAGKPEAVAQLLSGGADAWRGDNTGATALHHAAWEGQMGCLALLLQYADSEEATGSKTVRLVETTTNTGLTPLHYAAWRKQPAALKALINAGAPLAAPATLDTMGAVTCNAGSTPLHLAAMKCEVGIIRLLLRANAKLMSLAAAEAAAGLPASCSAISGAYGDLRKTAGKYGKTPAALAWDMQRSDVALILDPSTPLEQAIELATAAAKSGTSNSSSSSTNPATPPAPVMAPSRQQRGRRPGDVSVDSGPSTPVAAAAAAVNGSSSSSSRLFGEAASGLQRLGLNRSSSSKKGSSGGDAAADTDNAASSIGRPGGTIYLPPPKSRHSRSQITEGPAAAGSSWQQQQQQVRSSSSVGEDVEGDFGDFTGAASCDTGIGNNSSNSSEAKEQQVEQEQQQHPVAAVDFAAAAAAAAGGDSSPPAAFVCPITNEPFKDPVRACDGNAYEREAIEVWFQLGNSMYPGGRSRISSQVLTPDDNMKQAVGAWKAAAAAAAAAKQAECIHDDA